MIHESCSLDSIRGKISNCAPVFLPHDAYLNRAYVANIHSPKHELFFSQKIAMKALFMHKQLAIAAMLTFVLALWPSPTLAIENGTRVEDFVQPQVGIVFPNFKDGHGPEDERCTGTHLKSWLEPKTSYVLTAAHCDGADVQFRTRGASAGLEHTRTSHLPRVRRLPEVGILAAPTTRRPLPAAAIGSWRFLNRATERETDPLAP
jgi:hypothetical protein